MRAAKLFPAGATGANGEPEKVHVESGGAIWIRRLWVTDDDPKFSLLDLNQMWLPATAFAPSGCKISDREDLSEAIINAVRVQAAFTRPTKSQHLSIGLMARRLIKMFEYGWINGIYRISDWRSDHFQRLAEALKVGGWIGALQLRDRVEDYVKSLDDEGRKQLWITGNDGKERLQATSLLSALRTNVASRERSRLLAYTRSYLEKPRESVEFVREELPCWSAQSLMAELASINVLSAGDNPAFSFRPFPQVSATVAAKSMKVTRRTSSMRPEEAAQLLGGCLHWIEKIGPIVLKVVAELSKNSVNATKKYARDIEKAPSLIELNEALKVPVVSVAKIRGDNKMRGVALKAVVQTVYMACFIVIALFNARRKDEVMHPVIGLQRDSLRRLDADKNLHVCHFHIEKTINDRVVFYVGGLTVAAIQLLEKFSARFPEDPAKDTLDDKVDSIFRTPYCLRSGRRRNFDFYRYSRLENVELLSGDWLKTPLRPHMLRRAYALIFHYRYENSSLLALSYQLQHLDVEMTRVYVTDNAATAISASGSAVYGSLKPEQRKRLEEERTILDSDLKTVADEKVFLFVESVLASRERFSGGYARLVQRFHQIFGRSIQYSQMDVSGKARLMTERLINRRHEPLPMHHGACMAGESSSRLRGHCFDPEANALDRADAGPKVCATCPYHVVTAGHLQSLRTELASMENELRVDEQNSLQQRRDKIAASQLRQVVELHERRIEGNGVLQ